MENNNNDIADINNKNWSAKKYELTFMFENSWDYLSERAFNLEGCGFEMPPDFYNGFTEAFNLLLSMIDDDFKKYDGDDVINFDEIIANLCLDKTPKNPKELSDILVEVWEKRWYYEYLQWCEQFFRESQKGNLNIYMYAPEQTSFTLECAENIVKKHSEENLHICNHFEFGVLYGIVSVLDWIIRFYMA